MVALGFGTATALNAKESAEFAAKVLKTHGQTLTQSQSQRLTKLLTTSAHLTRNIDTENPDAQAGPRNSFHPASRAQCVDQVLTPGHIQRRRDQEALCGHAWMAPIPTRNGDVGSARVCIDRFEFPNIPCEYPIVWVAASQAKQICESMGKRLCDSHEWEGGCAGHIAEDYGFNSTDMGYLRAERRRYNARREKVFAFHWDAELKQRTDTRELCGVYQRGDAEITVSHAEFNSHGKSKACHSGGSDYRSCGTNTWPAGFKHRCVSEHGVYDMHGNVAEVVNFPRSPSGKGSVGGSDKTERKGSFFVYRKRYPNDCRVRQPFDHFNTVATDRHSYYQEGFRCCADITR